MARLVHAVSAIALTLAVPLSASGQTTTYGYDAQGRLKSSSQSNGSAAYTYDKADNRKALLITASGNHTPVAVLDTPTVVTGQSVTFDPRSNDTDEDHDTLTITAISTTDTGKGTISFTPTSITYNANANQSSSSDTFTYTISDGHGGTAVGTVTVSIQTTPSAPVVGNINASVVGNTSNNALPLSITGGTPTSVAVYAQPGSGTAVPSGLNIFYSPLNGWSGQTSLQYTASNSVGTSSPATANISVAPVVGNVTGNATAGQVKTLSLASYALTNVNSMSLASLPTQGTASISGTTLTYTPTSTATGTDTFSYTGSTVGGVSAPASIVFTVGSCPVPVVGDTSATVAYNSASNIIPLNLSGAAATSVNWVTTPSHGGVQPIGATMYYTTTQGYSGPDSFTYSASNACGTSNTATAHITISPPPNQPPVLTNDNISIAYNTPTEFFVLNNDYDPEGDPLTIVSTSTPAHGYSWQNGGNTVTYGPNSGYSGPDSFTYTVSDGHGNTSTATINITVQPPVQANNPPVLTDDYITIPYNTATQFLVLNNDYDPEGDPLTITGVSTPAHGNAWDNSGQNVTYSPNSGYSGSDSFTYTVSDGHGNTSTATIHITVAPPNSPPVANYDVDNVKQSTVTNLYPLANDTDPDNDALTIQSIDDIYVSGGNVNGVDVADWDNMGGVVNHGSYVTYTAPHITNSGSPGSSYVVVVYWYTISDGKGGTAQNYDAIIVSAP